jgi:hypothetical protein
MQKKLEPAWYAKLRRSSLGLSVAALAGILIGVSATTDAVDKISIWVGLKKNALDLARDNDRSRFSRDLTKAAWGRLFAMQRVVYAVENNFSDDERTREWNAYTAVLRNWNRDLMVNILLLQQFYGTEKRNEFENIIQPQFGKINSCLEGLKHPSSSPACKLSDIKSALKYLNEQLYCFVSGLPKEGLRCQQY